MTSKDKAIASIIKDLDKLTLEQNHSILKYIGESKKRNEHRDTSIQHQDRDGDTLLLGDRVYLLTKGINNSKGDIATVHSIPSKSGSYLKFVLERTTNQEHPTVIKKLSKSVRKVKE